MMSPRPASTDHHRARVNRFDHGPAATEITSIVVTHDMKSAFTINDRIAMVHTGHIICAGTVEQFRASRDPQWRISSRVARRSRNVETLTSS